MARKIEPSEKGSREVALLSILYVYIYMHPSHLGRSQDLDARCSLGLGRCATIEVFGKRRKREKETYEQTDGVLEGNKNEIKKRKIRRSVLGPYLGAGWLALALRSKRLQGV